MQADKYADLQADNRRHAYAKATFPFQATLQSLQLLICDHEDKILSRHQYIPLQQKSDTRGASRWF